MALDRTVQTICSLGSLVLFAGCSTVLGPAPSLGKLRAADSYPTSYHRLLREPGAGLSASDGGTRLVYMSNYNSNTVRVFRRNSQIVRDIGGFSGPQGIFVDDAHRLWVANTSANNVLVFARGGTTPIKILHDLLGFPTDVTLCPNGTAYVSNSFSTDGDAGNIEVFAPGNTYPTGSLTYRGKRQGGYVTCDANNNVFATFSTKRSLFEFVEYPGGHQSGVKRLPIKQGSVADIDTCGGKLYVNDPFNSTVTEYTEAGSPTGNFINVTDSLSAIALSQDCKAVAGADGNSDHGVTWTFPGGVLRQSYPGSSTPLGIAFDPG